jgi:hypothetical protein
MRTAMLLAAVGLLTFSNRLHGQVKVEIEKTGTTNQKDSAKFNWQMANLGGKKIDPVNPINKVEVGGAVIPATDYQSNTDQTNQKGSITVIKPNIPKGKRKVKLTIKLNDGTTVSGEQEVDFQLILFGPWLVTPALLILRLRGRRRPSADGLKVEGDLTGLSAR